MFVQWEVWDLRGILCLHCVCGFNTVFIVPSCFNCASSSKRWTIKYWLKLCFSSLSLASSPLHPTSWVLAAQLPQRCWCLCHLLDKLLFNMDTWKVECLTGCALFGLLCFCVCVWLMLTLTQLPRLRCLSSMQKVRIVRIAVCCGGQQSKTKAGSYKLTHKNQPLVSDSVNPLLPTACKGSSFFRHTACS